jgi:hypothetical protein
MAHDRQPDDLRGSQQAIGGSAPWPVRLDRGGGSFVPAAESIEGVRGRGPSPLVIRRRGAPHVIGEAQPL